jgi:chemotaxis protein methyltransferase CheR
MAVDTEHIEVSDAEFQRFRALFADRIGLHLSDHKRLLLTGRLSKRVHALGLKSFDAYYRHLRDGKDPAEFETAVGLITTHETYFFREPHHFELLAGRILQERSPGRTLKVWCGAASTGEEPWSIAMVLHDKLGTAGWNLMASDVSRDVLQKASRALYSTDRISGIPPHYLKTYCLKGTGDYAGKLLVDRVLRERVEFRAVNLMEIPPDISDLDVVFLRNVIIYFDAPTKLRVLSEICSRIRPGGWLLLGHSESLAGMDLPVEQIRPSVFRKEA